MLTQEPSAPHNSPLTRDIYHCPICCPTCPDRCLVSPSPRVTRNRSGVRLTRRIWGRSSTPITPSWRPFVSGRGGNRCSVFDYAPSSAQHQGQFLRTEEYAQYSRSL